MTNLSSNLGRFFFVSPLLALPRQAPLLLLMGESTNHKKVVSRQRIVATIKAISRKTP